MDMDQNEETKQPRRGRRRLTGVVESDKRDKTVKVVVNFLSKHRMYGKYIRRRTVVQAHDPENEARSGDTVELMECRPISKTKTWRLVKVVRRGVGATA